MAKQYRILEKIYGEGTKHQETIYYPQVMNSHTLNANIEPWEFYNKDDDQCVYFHDMDAALEYVEKRVAEDTPVRTIIHSIK